MNIYGYWFQGELNEFTKQSIKQTKINNPYLKYTIFDNAKARTFIRKYFPENVLNAYDTLIPKAYKSDLFRYCILYIKGGLYIDVKLILNKIPKSVFDKEEYLIAQGKKRKGFHYKPIENSFLYFKNPKNPLLLKCIDQILLNVKKRDKTKHNLLTSACLLVGNIFKDVKPTMKFKSQSKPRKFIFSYNGYPIVNNDLTPYYGNKKHETFWKLFKNDKVFYDVVPQEYKTFAHKI
jgi:mannosyltransferase OCH1-like enzyme